MAEHERIDETTSSRVAAKTRSVCVLAAWWRIWRSEVYEGVIFALDLAIGALDEALEAMNGEQPSC